MERLAEVCSIGWSCEASQGYPMISPTISSDTYGDLRTQATTCTSPPPRSLRSECPSDGFGVDICIDDKVKELSNQYESNPPHIDSKIHPCSPVWPEK